jgi:hypothetical protein
VSLVLAFALAITVSGCNALYAITGTPIPKCEIAWDTLRLDTLQGAPVFPPDRCVEKKP